MVVFNVVRQGSFNFSLRSKIVTFVFFICCNILTAQAFAQSCRKLSPIVYKEDVYVKDGGLEDGKNIPVYLPDLLMTKEERDSRLKATTI